VTADELATLSSLTARARDLVAQLDALAGFDRLDRSGAEGLRDALEGLRTDIGQLTRVVQDRECRTWPRLPGPTPGIAAGTRLTLQGRPPDAAAPPLLGRWQNGARARIWGTV